jgi:folate-dependent phosphoribosylglycinamide formyltransferase PurN
MTEKSGVVILSASSYSAFSISVLKLLLDQEVPIRGVMILKLVDRNRLLKELKTSGFSIFGKIFRKLILQRLGIGKSLKDGFSAYYKTLGKQPASLIELCEQHGIPYNFTSDFHAVDSLQFIEDSNCKLVAFTGGGLIRQPLIAKAGIGVLNCHMGLLPKYRGMDCTYWCSLNLDRENIGFTVHLMDAGIDTGPIFKTHRVDVSQVRTVDQAVFEIEYQMAPAMADAIAKIVAGDATFRPQNVAEGQQYYTLSPECLDLSRRLFNA